MEQHSLFWIAMVIYAFVLLFFLYMTRTEQTANRVPWRRAIVGFAGCIVWPITVCIVVLMMLHREIVKD